MLTILAEPDVSPPAVSSEAAIVIDGENCSVMYKKEAAKKLYPASLTKIATAIYAIENGNLNDTVTVSEKARDVEGTRVYLEAGEQVSLKKLLQGLLINSGNDAGIAIAEHLHGSVETFSTHINKYLREEIGVQNTNFRNPHGLFHSNHLTTAEDLAKILQYAMKNETFRTIFGTEKLKWQGESWNTMLYSHHKLLRDDNFPEVTGGKTGFIDQAGFTLATTAEQKNRKLIVVTLNSVAQVNAYNDTATLLTYGFEHFQTSTIPAGTTFKTDEQVYKTTKPLSFTHSKGEEVTKELKNSGKLEITDQSGNVIVSYQLDKPSSDKGTATSSTEKTSAIAGTSAALAFKAVIVLFIIALFLRIRKVRRRRRRRMNRLG